MVILFICLVVAAWVLLFWEESESSEDAAYEKIFREIFDVTEEELPSDELEILPVNVVELVHFEVMPPLMVEEEL